MVYQKRKKNRAKKTIAGPSREVRKALKVTTTNSTKVIFRVGLVNKVSAASVMKRILKSK